MACHTPKGPRGREFANKLGALAAPSFRDPGGVSVSRNITSSKTNGIGGWTDDEIKRAITQASARMAASSIRPWASTTTPQCQLPTSTPSSPICVRCRQKRIVPKPLCHAFAGQSVFVQVFGRRHDEPFHALWRPASKKRQGTKSREVGHRRCSGRYGDLMAAPSWKVDVTPTGCGRRICTLARLEAYNWHLGKRSERINEHTVRR